MQDNQATPKFFPTLMRLMRISGSNRIFFYSSVILDLVTATYIVFQNHLLRGLFDSVIALKKPEFLRITVILVILGLCSIPLAYFRTRFAGLFGEKTLYTIRQRVAEKINRFPIQDLEERHSGDFLSVLNADLARLKNLLGSDMLELIQQSSQGLGALIYIFLISWQLTLVSLILTPLVFILLSMLTGPISRRSNQLQEEVGSLNSLAQDALNGLSITRAFNLTQLMDERFNAHNRVVVRKGLGIARPRSLAESLSIVIGFTPFIITFGFGGYLTINGQMTFGSLFAFINLLNFVANPLSNIPRLVSVISESVGASQRIFDILDHESERSGGQVSSPSNNPGPVIRFRHVSFAYEPGSPVLQDVSLDIQEGESVAIVGPSGSGKSTLIKLILGFYPLEEGTIELFTQDIDRWNLAEARKAMAFVAQDTYLFPVSIEENILCGDLQASTQAVQQAAAAANIDAFIQSLPEGYQTMVGERGARLSGGQRQRIALARAILKNAPILLLDEPTSALDTESEALVQDALEHLMADHTSIVIAHRLSTIRNADRILVLDQGRIVEEGSHEALLASGGLYLDLYQSQFNPGNGG